VQAAKTADGPSIAIVGVTGAVGQEFLRVSIIRKLYIAFKCLHEAGQGPLDSVEVTGYEVVTL
jgi:aspartate-semialdehyde dehydrogenase